MVLDFINKLCEQNSTTFAQLEKELGFGNGTIRKWSESSPGIDKILKVADRFGVSVDYLIKGDSMDLSAVTVQISRLIESLPREKQELAHRYIRILGEKEESEAC